MLEYINTPVGQFDVPYFIKDRINKMSDIELLQEYVDKCKNFIDPFLFAAMINRNLIFSGERLSDVEKRLESIKDTENKIIEENWENDFEIDVDPYGIGENDFEEDYEI